MNDEKQRKRELEIIEYLRKQEELTPEQAEAARAGSIALAGRAGNEPQSLQGHECLVFFLGGETGGDRK